MAHSEADSSANGSDIFPNQVGTFFDLSKRDLHTLSTEVCSRFQNVQFCYLDENRLINLPDTFFQAAPLLEWLDLRGNNLETLPTTGLAGHPNLKVLLLQNNRIKYLPFELAAVPQLKGLQIAGNPIENVPFEIIAQGLSAVMKFLRKIAKENNTLLPVSETIITNPSQKQASGVVIARDYQTSRGAVKPAETRKELLEHSEPLESTLNVLSYSNAKVSPEQLQEKLKRRPRKEFKSKAQVSSVCRVLARKGTPFNYKLVTLERVASREKEDCERLKLQETLDRQSQILQRLKDMEAVKRWRKMTLKKGLGKLLDNFQYSPSRNFLDKTPFDVDPDMLRMLSRDDLYKSLKDWEEHDRRAFEKNRKSNREQNTCEIEKQIENVKKRLVEMNLKQEIANTSNEKKVHLTTRMDEIKHLRKNLMALQGNTFGFKNELNS